jgi:hypothetical protein
MGSGRDLHGWDIEQEIKDQREKDLKKRQTKMASEILQAPVNSKKLNQFLWMHENREQIWAMKGVIEMINLPSPGRNEGEE